MRVVSTAQMPHSTERGGDLTTLGPGGWTHRTLEEVHEGVDVGLDEEREPSEREEQMMTPLAPDLVR